VVNNLLQGRIENAGHNTFRLLANLTFGFGGLLDPATSMGLPARDTDFGETLHVWGSGEGAYIEVPLLGPSTQRDTVGDVVDIALNPLGWAEGVGPVALAAGIWLFDGLADRGRFGSAIDDVLYNSADSYAQTRLIYLQNRRFELSRNAGRSVGGGLAPGPEGVVVDPYADPFGEGVDPYADPYGEALDPYADPAAGSYTQPQEETDAQ
jgi:phospholipid-binding lipoprotein MlaA